MQAAQYQPGQRPASRLSFMGRLRQLEQSVHLSFQRVPAKRAPQHAVGSSLRQKQFVFRGYIDGNDRHRPLLLDRGNGSCYFDCADGG